jgi:hypothetical protein
VTIILKKGAHPSPEEGMCLMEAVSFVVGEPFGDDPSCVSPALAGFGRTLNDGLPYNARQQLTPLIPKLIGTVNPEQDQRDGLRCAHWIIAHWLPTWLDLVPRLKRHATALRELPESYSQTWAGVTNDAYRAARAARGMKWTPSFMEGGRAEFHHPAAATGKIIFGTRKAAMVMAQLWDPDSYIFLSAAQAAVAACEARWRYGQYSIQPTILQLQQDSIDLFTELVEGRK